MSAPESELRAAPVVLRGELYGRRPNGVGTPLLECLTGYLARVCEARSISVVDALDLFLRPLVPPKLLRSRQQLPRYLKSHIASNFDGMTWHADAAVMALEELMGETGLAVRTHACRGAGFSPGTPPGPSMVAASGGARCVTVPGTEMGWSRGSHCSFAWSLCSGARSIVSGSANVAHHATVRNHLWHNASPCPTATIAARGCRSEIPFAKAVASTRTVKAMPSGSGGSPWSWDRCCPCRPTRRGSPTPGGSRP